MTSITSAVKRTIGEVTADQKQSDLMRDTVDPQKDYPSRGMTTMHGMPFYNTQTWYGIHPFPGPCTESDLQYQAESYASRGHRSCSS